MDKDKNFLLSLLKGVILSFIISLILFYILGIILSISSIPEKIITPSIIIITSISIFISSSISIYKCNNRGAIRGGLIGLLYFLFLYLISSIILNNYEINIYSIIMLFCSFLFGIIGGIIGINIKK